MGYRIEYGSDQKYCRIPRARPGAAMMTVLVFSLFVFAVCIFWQEGREVLSGILFSGDPDGTFVALEEMADKLREGTDFREAVMVFCREILNESAGY